MSSAAPIKHNERVHHVVVDSPYCLPADEGERQRLIRQHYALKKHAGRGTLLAGPVNLPSHACVLDSGTGSGIWALDIVKDLPSTATVYGIDIESRLFPAESEQPANVVFQDGSILSLPDDWTSKFDLIHQRLLLYALRAPEWIVALQSMIRCVKPGGTIQLTEVVTPPNTEAGPYNRKWYSLLDKFCADRGILLHCAKVIPGMLKTVGFENVACYETGLVLGSKGGSAGMDARKSRIGAFRGMKTPILNAGGLGFISTAEEFDELLDGVEREWEETGLAQAAYVHIMARRPLASIVEGVEIPVPVTLSKPTSSKDAIAAIDIALFDKIIHVSLHYLWRSKSECRYCGQDSTI